MAHLSSPSASLAPSSFSPDPVQPPNLLLHVDVNRGDDSFPGTSAQPLRTIQQAIRQAVPGTLISISAGTYSAQTGEVFPLIINQSIALVGAADDPVMLTGGGRFSSTTQRRQSVTVVMENDSTIRGLTITNPNPQGTGVWIETGQPTVSYCQLVQCQREGMVVSDTGHPLVSHCVFEDNQASGILFLDQSSGIFERNTILHSTYGLAIGDRATPKIWHNTLRDHHHGVTIAGTAQPLLLCNRITYNRDSGLVLLNDARPMLGNEQQPGGNIIHHNQRWDIHNQTNTTLMLYEDAGGGHDGRSHRFSGPITVSHAVPQAMSNAMPSIAQVGQPLGDIATKPPTASLTAASALGLPAATQASAVAQATGAEGTAADTAPLFPDLHNHWGQAFVEQLHQHTIIQGFPDGTFKPDQSLTRAQYAALLHKMFSLPPFELPNINPARPFRDVSPQFWAATAIQHASQMGFIAGFPDGTFRPEEDLSRAQAIVSLVNGLRLTGGDQEGLQRYSDRTAIPNYAKDEVATATDKALIVNYPDPAKLSPKQSISRAEIATMLYQVRVITGQSVAIASPYLIQPPRLSVSFKDVLLPPQPGENHTGHWAEGFIYGLANQGFISGTSADTFAPERAVSRAEFAILLTKLFNPLARPDAQLDQKFVDVPKRFWAYDAIQRVVQAGLMSGFDDGSFQPQQDVRRWQVFLSVVQALGLPQDQGTQLERFYVDAESIPSLAEGAIATATHKKLVVNYPIPNRINASRGATRAEVAATLYQSLAFTKRLPSLSSSFVVSTPIAAPAPSPTPPPLPAPAPTPAPAPPVSSTVILPTVLLSAVQPSYAVANLERYLFGYANQSHLIAQAIGTQLRQQDIHVVWHNPLHTPSDPASNPTALIPTDSNALIRLQVSETPQANTASEALTPAAPANADEVAWHMQILFSPPANPAQTSPSLPLAERLHQAILSRAGVADGGVRSTDTLWPELTDAQQGESKPSNASGVSQPLTPAAAVLIHLSPVTQITDDYPPIPIGPLVWAIATGTVDFLRSR